MAHELLINDGEASMMYVGEVPWHGLSTKLDRPATAEEAICAAKLDWEVEKKPLCFRDGSRNPPVPDRYVVVPGRGWDGDTRPVFGIVSKSFQPLQNREAFSFFDPIVGKDAAVYHTAGALGEGERIWILAKLPDHIRVIGDDITDKYLLLSNSHDGHGAVQIKFTPRKRLASPVRSTRMPTLSPRPQTNPSWVDSSTCPLPDSCCLSKGQVDSPSLPQASTCLRRLASACNLTGLSSDLSEEQTMQSQPFLGWVDFSEDDQKRARDYLRALDEGTVDELGFGIMRDAFADVFFPATSTIMTHSRYFIFVPAIYIHLEEQGIHRNAAERKRKQLEQRLRMLLAANGQITIHGAEVQRYPSSIYWNALKKLGVFLHDWSQRYYHDHLREIRESRRPIQDDDGSLHRPRFPGEQWDQALLELHYQDQVIRPNEAGDFPADTTIELNSQEARYLKDKFTKPVHAGATSLMAHLLTMNRAADFAYPWEAPCPDVLSSESHHAERLSMAARGATLLYYAMLIEEKENRGMTNCGYDLHDVYSAWWTASRDVLREWDLSEFLQLMSREAAVRGRDMEFFKTWQKCIRSIDRGSDLYESERTRDIIARREREKRPARRVFLAVHARPVLCVLSVCFLTP